tara:strand:- start:143 stop:718 length:576 start_codon:yes stop_codon:yes gene_type:complete
MGLKDDLIKAKIESLKTTGVSPSSINASPGSALDIECEMTKEAIIKFLEKAEFRVTKFVAPVILEDFIVPDQTVDVDPNTLYQPHTPIIDAVSTIATVVGQTEVADTIDFVLKKSIGSVAGGGATLPALDLNKDGRSKNQSSVNKGIVESTGYAFVGDDPDSNKVFNVEDEDGQRLHTTVKFFRGDNEDLL